VIVGDDEPDGFCPFATLIVARPKRLA